MSVGTVQEAGGGVYRICLEDDSIVEASLRGRVKHRSREEDRIVVGDRVELSRADDGHLCIESRLPRSTRLVRARPGGRFPKVMAANLDRLFVVLAASRPEPRPELADRMFAMGEAGGLEGVLVINKMDQPGAEAVADDLEAWYRGTGYPVLRVSAENGRGVELLAEALCSGRSALVGPSGAGKSSLLSCVQPGLALRVGPVSERAGRGRHTTVSSRLIDLECGGQVADTPGFSDATLWGVSGAELDYCFPEFRPLRDACHFRACTHVHEPGCEVKGAVARGEVSEGRYSSYLRILEDEPPGH